MVLFGHIPDVYIGQVFPDRRSLHNSNIHRGLMRGIAPQGTSIVLSGGYIDDVDRGDEIVYTGEGGRDENTGRQITHQTFTGGNFNLAHNYIEGKPIRVNRGHELDSPFAPSVGYRYDGLYRIDSYWSETGRDGYFIGGID
jgi:putative restriction endonuclease